MRIGRAAASGVEGWRILCLGQGGQDLKKCASLISIVSAFFEPDSFVKKTRLKPEKMNKASKHEKSLNSGNDKLTTQKKMFGDVWRCSENFSSDLAEVNCQLQLAWLCHVMVWN